MNQSSEVTRGQLGNIKTVEVLGRSFTAHNTEVNDVYFTDDLGRVCTPNDRKLILNILGINK